MKRSKLCLRDKSEGKKYEVYVDDNFHFMDESERYRVGEFQSHDEAVAACKKVVDGFLEGEFKKGMSSEELYELYMMFGEDPFIIPSDEAEHFSAWEYAKGRCMELCNGDKK